MGYTNGKEILPAGLLEQIQRYVEGQLIYIPCKAENQKHWGENTATKKMLALRNREIIQKYKSGCRVIELAADYHLSIQAVYKIISQQKNR